MSIFSSTLVIPDADISKREADKRRSLCFSSLPPRRAGLSPMVDASQSLGDIPTSVEQALQPSLEARIITELTDRWPSQTSRREKAEIHVRPPVTGGCVNGFPCRP